MEIILLYVCGRWEEEEQEIEKQSKDVKKV